MNIFFVDRNPIEAAVSLCDQHVVKMPLESAIMLCAPFEGFDTPYKRSWLNHPCTVWASKSYDNYFWLLRHAFALCEEYTYRYEKTHASEDVVLWCQTRLDHLRFRFPEQGFSDPPQAMPKEFQGPDTVQAYRDYYCGEKSRFARWQRGRSAPSWYLIDLLDRQARQTAKRPSR
jgi:hypothetical protein